MRLFIIYNFRHPSKTELVQSFSFLISLPILPKLLKSTSTIQVQYRWRPFAQGEPRAQPKVQMLRQQSLPKL
jgi:hypothetical protein